LGELVTEGFVGLVEGVAGHRMLQGEVLTHPYGLGSLTGK
jgi:hypothetical protein